VQPIFDQNCVKCHGGSNGVKGGLTLKSYDDLTKGGKDGQVINPGDPANSMLVQAIVEGKMPKQAAKLPQAQIDTISAWVAAGAQNN
jgi:mono/diheme cytochrome c family protein